MVKSGQPDAVVMDKQPDARAPSLRHATSQMLHVRRLAQTTPVTAPQLHDVAMMVNPVLVPFGSSVAVLSDPSGSVVTDIARLRPHWNVAGWVPDTKTFLQLQTMVVPDHVSFDKIPSRMPASGEPLRAIFVVSWMHRCFSSAHYHVSGLVNEVRRLLDLLPEYGQLLIQDIALPDDPEAFVMLDIEDDEAAEALVAFSKSARPDMVKALQGFFVETLPSPRAGVTRFHLPQKWATEFYHRWRLGIANDAPFELTTLSLPQWTALIEQCGARVSYRAPHFAGRKESAAMAKTMRFVPVHMRDHDPHQVAHDETVLSYPPHSFTLVVEKLPEQTPLSFYERRIAEEKTKDILISGIRNRETGDKMDVVEIRHHEDDILPWYFDSEMRLHVLVRSHVARPVINAVPRGTPNLDGREWAGYLIEPLALPSTSSTLDPDDIAETMRALLPPQSCIIGKATAGVDYYPAPEYLVQRVRGIFLPVKPLGKMIPVGSLEDGSRLFDVLADDVLHAISSGLIPDGKLEILIARLMIEQGVQPVSPHDVSAQSDLKKVFKAVKDKREVRAPRTIKSGSHLEAFIADTPTEKRRAVRSVFVEEHISDYGRQIARVEERDFIVPNNFSANTAVCLPLMRDPVGGFLLSTEPRTLPIPQRMGATEPMAHLPAFALPNSVTTLEQARVFLARQLQCNADDLYVLGPGFFAHSHISAERVYPFLLNAMPYHAQWARWYKPTSKSLRRMLMPQIEKTAAYMEFKVARDFGEWYSGFTPDMTRGLTEKTSVSHTAPDSAAFLARHPMVMPTLE